MGSTAFNGEVWTNVHPDIMRLLCEANALPVDGKTGDDSFSLRADALMKAQFSSPVRTAQVLNGTAANMLALKCMLRPWSSVLCAGETHINCYECGAAEYNLRAKILSVPTGDGKLTPEHVSRLLAACERCGYVPTVLALTQPTELGVLYRPGELAALTRLAHGHGMAVYLDGARIAYAMEALGTNLGGMIEGADIDAFTFGGTKCGAMFGEMVVFRRAGYAEHLAYLQKQSMQHLDKSKFIGAQLGYLLEDERWRALAARVNATARLLARELAARDIRPCFPADTNMVFCRLTKAQMDRVNSVFDLPYWDRAEGTVRLCVSHETTREQVDALVSLL